MRIFRQTTKGLSLIEVVIAMAAFAIILTGTTQLFSQGAKNFQAIKQLQMNLETAQFALNTLAKEARTSSIVAHSGGTASSTVTLFDYSQDRCIQYRFNESSGLAEKRSHVFNSTDPNRNRSDCLGYTFAEPYEILLTGISNQAISVVRSREMADSSGPMVGRLTVSLTVGTAGTAATIQTTVSLRDFNFVGI